MGELSRQIDREDAKKFVPVSYWSRGPAGWLFLAALAAALLKHFRPDTPVLENVDWVYVLVVVIVLGAIWAITSIRINLAVGGDENVPLD